MVGKANRGKVIATEVQKYVKEFRATIPINPPKATPPPKRWSPPSPGWYKVNVDGVVFRDRGKIGVGVVIRNDRGELMGAMSQKIYFPWEQLRLKRKQWKNELCWHGTRD